MSAPYIGRVVHYVAFGTPGGEYPVGVHRAALITQVWDDQWVGLCVLNPTGLFFHEKLRYDRDGRVPATWHFLEDDQRAAHAGEGGTSAGGQ